jgi:hypothetical protein
MDLDGDERCIEAGERPAVEDCERHANRNAGTR